MTTDSGRAMLVRSGVRMTCLLSSVCSGQRRSTPARDGRTPARVVLSACASLTSRMHSRLLLAIAAVAVVLALLVAPSSTLAHERRTVGSGKYDVVVGWETEPAYVNQHNAAGIRISKAGTNPAEPVTGAENTLKVQIRQGAQTRLFELRAVFGQPGYYVADIVPTRAGDCAWTFTGTLGADQINEAFDSADGKFDAVSAGSDVQFPVASPDPDQVSAQLQATNAAVQRAQLVAYAAVGLAVIGCLVALAVCLTRPRAGTGVLSSRDAAVRRPRGAGL